MPLSRYLKAYPCEEDPNRLLVFSTRTVAKLLMSRERFRALAEGGQPSPAEQGLLARLGLLVDDPEEEEREVLRFFEKLNIRKTGLSLMVALNLDCNFACTYCYEAGMKGGRYMSEETADRLVDFIQQRFPEPGKEILLDFYGGEPLLSLGLIERISRPLLTFAKARGADYRFTLITNGSLFTRRVAQTLVPLGLSGVKITLDGPAEVHDRCRPFKSGRGSFATILANIRETCDLTQIGISGNFQRENEQRFPLLLDDLQKQGLGPGRIAQVKFDPVLKQQPAGEPAASEGAGGCASINEAWLADASLRLREEILKRGYKTPRISPVACMVETEDSYVVHYDGGIYKCPGFLGKSEYQVGDVRRGVDGAAVYRCGIFKNDVCTRCGYLPLCFGGCRYMKYLRDRDLGGTDCPKAYLDASLERLVKQEIRYGSLADQRERPGPP